MATLTEITELLGDPGGLGPKIRGALLVEANLIVGNAAATEAQKAWARACFAEPSQFAAQALSAVLAANTGFTKAQIQGAADSAVQTAVHNAMPTLTG